MPRFTLHCAAKDQDCFEQDSQPQYYYACEMYKLYMYIIGKDRERMVGGAKIHNYNTTMYACVIDTDCMFIRFSIHNRFTPNTL